MSACAVYPSGWPTGSSSASGGTSSGGSSGSAISLTPFLGLFSCSYDGSYTPEGATSSLQNPDYTAVMQISLGSGPTGLELVGLAEGKLSGACAISLEVTNSETATYDPVGQSCQVTNSLGLLQTNTYSEGTLTVVGGAASIHSSGSYAGTGFSGKFSGTWTCTSGAGGSSSSSGGSSSSSGSTSSGSSGSGSTGSSSSGGSTSSGSTSSGSTSSGSTGSGSSGAWACALPGFNGFAPQTTFDTASDGSEPTALVVGDFNGDGQLDVAVTNNDDTVGVFLGLVDGSFGAPATFGVGSKPGSLAVGDFNGDGRPDLAVGNYGDNTVSVLLNSGDWSGGGFGPQTTFAVGTEPSAVAAGDFDGDGRPDLAVANDNGASAGTVSVLLNAGDGGFAPQITYAVGAGPQSVAVGDFYGDGKPDLAVANYNDGTVGLLRNLGDAGTWAGFASQVIISDAGQGPIGLAAGDFNGDGALDLAMANEDMGFVGVLANQGAGSFAAMVTYAVGSGISSEPISVAVGDFNGDGRPDLAVANDGDYTVSVLLNDPSGGFSAQVTFATGSASGSGLLGPVGLAVGDFLRDGRADLVVANEGESTLSVLISQDAGVGAGDFGAQVPYAVGSGANSVAVADFDGDGRLDLAVTNGGDGSGNTVSVLLGVGMGSFGAQATFTVGSGPNAVAVGDFNGDGREDLVTANSGDGTVSVLLGTGAGSFGAQATFAVGSGPQSVAVADLDGDGSADLAVANRTGGSVSVLLGTGSGSFGAQASFTVGSNPYAVAVGDFNDDGKPDLAVVNNTSAGTVSILLNQGGGAFGGQAILVVGVNPQAVAVGDFNGDGQLDLAVANAGSGQENGTVSILLGNGAGGFGSQVTFPVGGDAAAVAVGDFNRDGKPDLAVANGNDATVSVLLGTGTGSFGAQVTFGVEAYPYSLAVGDFAADGMPGLAVTSNGTTVSVLLNACMSF